LLPAWDTKSPTVRQEGPTGGSAVQSGCPVTLVFKIALPDSKCLI
jgi:hypothetical protein